jgi:hypothetical protein
VFDAASSSDAVVAPQRAGNALVLHNAQGTSPNGRSYQRSVRLGGLEQGFGYIVHAVAQDLNRPIPNRMTALCTAPTDPLVCAPVDRPCVKSLQVACECIGRAQAQVTVQVGKRSASGFPGGFRIHYMLLEAVLPVSQTPINSTGFPLPTFDQIREGVVGTATAVVPAAGSLCVGNDQMTTFSIPSNDTAVALAPDREYIVCVIPPEINNATCSSSVDEAGSPVPECVTFSTFAENAQLDCSVTGCDCFGTSDCSLQLTCQTDDEATALMRYMVGPSECSGLRGVACHNFFAPPPNDCCPSMDSPLNRALDCCPVLAQGELDIRGTMTTTISGMQSCGDVDVVACAARTNCHRCPDSQLCNEQRPFREQELSRQESCRSTPLEWLPDRNGTCSPVNKADPGPAPIATVFSSPELFTDFPCADDNCAPGLCQVTVCKPGSNGTCSALQGPSNTVYALADSPGTVCCVALPHTSRVPPAYNILEKLIPANQPSSGHGCATFSSARQWQEVVLLELDHDAGSGIYMVRHQCRWQVDELLHTVTDCVLTKAPAGMM